MSTPLFDPNDPLVSDQDLIQSALEVLSELRNPPTISDTDPEWLDALFEYLGEVLEALRERQANINGQ